MADSLPYYCVPALIIPMEDLSKTPRGKLDKRLLLSLAEAEFGHAKIEAAE